MKKLNNKGFAISSLLYGLLLVAFLVVSVLMSIMASNRKNTSSLIEKIDDELSRHSNTVTEFSSQSEAQEFIVPYGKAGWYKIELWGAAGAGSIGDAPTNRGSYTSGTVYLEENTHLYFYVGESGTAGSIDTFNHVYSSTAGGGGATDVRTVSGGANYDDEASRQSIIMLAAGGANGGHYQDSIYKASNASASFISGYGGQRIEENLPFVGGYMFHAINGGAGKARIELVSQNPKTSVPAKKSTKLTGVKYVRDCITVSGLTNNGGKELWSEVQVILPTTGVNLMKTLEENYPSLDHLNYQISSLGNTSMAAITGTKSHIGATRKCLQIDLKGTYDIEELTFFHYLTSGTTITRETVEVSYTTASTWTILKEYNSAAGFGYYPSETVEGVKLTDRQVENLNSVPAGNYYLSSALWDGRLITATTSSDGKNVSKLLFYEGQKKQKWTINAVDGANIYKITETEDNFALQPTQTDASGIAVTNSTVSTLGEYTGQTWEKWKLNHQSNGYYLIESVSNPGYCLTAENPSQNYPIKLAACNKTSVNQSFKLVNAEY